MNGKMFSILLVLALLAFNVSALSENGLYREIKVNNAALLQVAGDTVNFDFARIYYDQDADGTRTYFADVKIASRYLEQAQYARFYAGDERQFDTNADGINDLSVKLDSLSPSTKASFVFTELQTERLSLQEEPKASVVKADVMVKEPEAMVKEETMEKKEATLGGVGTEGSDLEPITGEAVKETGTGSSKTWTWTIVGIIVLIAIIVYATRKRQE